MIKEIIEHKNKYIWSKSEEGTIVVGGSNGGRSYGQIELVLNKSEAVVRIDISDGVTSTKPQPARHYSHLTPEYRQIQELYDTIDDYLNDPNTKIDQNIYRVTLLQNVFNLLAKYPDID